MMLCRRVVGGVRVALWRFYKKGFILGLYRALIRRRSRVVSLFLFCMDRASFGISYDLSPKP